jgi:hypothetical protein
MWFKVDDKAYGHPKFLMCSTQAIGVWTLMGSWSSEQLTDGFIPKGAIGILRAADGDVAELIGAGLLSVVDGGWQMHDFADYNPASRDIREARAKDAERKRRQRRGSDGRFVTDGVRADSIRTSGRTPSGRPDGVTLDVRAESEKSPSVPTRPVPNRSTSQTDVDDDAIDAIGDNTDDTIDDSFKQWWSHVPKKVGKGQARRSFKQALKKTDLSTLTSAMDRYARSVKDADPKFVAHPATWLNGERWDDEPDIPQADVMPEWWQR